MVSKAYDTLKSLAYTKPMQNTRIALTTIVPGHFPDADECLLLAYHALQANMTDDKILSTILMHRRAQKTILVNPYIQKPIRPASHSVAYQCTNLNETVIQALNILAIERNMLQHDFYSIARQFPNIALPKLTMLWDFIKNSSYEINSEVMKYTAQEVKTHALNLCDHVIKTWPEHTKSIQIIQPDIEVLITP